MGNATKVLIIDDDPTRLKIYGWIVTTAGYEALLALVTADRIDFPDRAIDQVLLDYRLTGQITAVEAVAQIRSRYAEAPIIVLSDLYDLPADVAPLVQAFVRKGEPGQLVNTLARFPRARAVQPDSAA
jgi:DNA-binding response OmpR family regulator